MTPRIGAFVVGAPRIFISSAPTVPCQAPAANATVASAIVARMLATIARTSRRKIILTTSPPSTLSAVHLVSASGRGDLGRAPRKDVAVAGLPLVTARASREPALLHP